MAYRPNSLVASPALVSGTALIFHLRCLGRRRGHVSWERFSERARSGANAVRRVEEMIPRSEGRPDTERITHVFAPWHTAVGPSLSLGMLTAYARSVQAERLGNRYEIHRPERADLVRDAITNLTDPPILLCTDYLWSSDDNLALAAEVVALNPQCLVIHGGPNCPSYAADAEAFLRRHGPLAGILVHGEGEEALAELLESIEGQPESFRDGRIHRVAGISFLDVDGNYVRTGKRERRANLDELPSPYLTGEFDHIETAAWTSGAYFETNRGCPYGCTFCDWGSATLSRIRMFGEDRVMEELSWAANRQFPYFTFCDANFGIVRRDVRFAQRICDEKKRTGVPTGLGFSPAKNTVKNLAGIVQLIRDCDIELHCDMGIQSVADETLAAVNRSNISTSNYLELLSELRQKDNFVPCDLLMGLPGQTVDSFRGDLQFAVDNDVQARIHTVRLLPNSPMNAPEYREEWGIVVDDDGYVQQTTSFTLEERARMFRLVHTYVIADHLAVFRHVMRFVQWDRGVPALDVLQLISDRTLDEPNWKPALGRLIDSFLREQRRPDTWDQIYAEYREVLIDEFGVVDGDDLDAALAAQQFLMPRRLSGFPKSLPVAHDVVAYHQSATRALIQGKPNRPSGPLNSFGPASVEILADPLGLCGRRRELNWGEGVLGPQGLFHIYFACFELLTPLRSSFAGRRFRVARPDLIPLIESTAVVVDRDEIVDLGESGDGNGDASVRVTLGRTRPTQRA